jgi:lactoylglutathione lyase
MKFGCVITYVKDVSQTAAFWKAAFGIETRFVVPTGDYAELETGHAAIAFAAHALGQSNLPQGYAPADASALPQGQELALVTDDVEAALAHAVQAGARLVSPAKVKPWGQTVGYVCTPDGNLIELCSPMPSGTT